MKKERYIDPQFIPRCVTCGHLSDIPGDFGDSEWGTCNAWGLKDKRHKDTTCYRWTMKMKNNIELCEIVPKKRYLYLS